LTLSIPNVEPDQITQGDYIQWKRSLGDFPASDSWILSYNFVTDGDQQSTSGQADGDDHLLTLTTGESAVFTVARYRFQAHVEKGAERYTLNGQGSLPYVAGEFDVLQDFATATTGFDFRTPAKQAFDDLEAAIIAHVASKATIGTYSIAERSVSFNSLDELISMRDRYRDIVRREEEAERLKQGKSHSGVIKVEMS